MSVDVKTPTKTQFEHIDTFPCGEREVGQLSSAAGALFTCTGTEANGEGKSNSLPGRRYTISCAKPESIRGRKRRFSERASLGAESVPTGHPGPVNLTPFANKKRFGRGFMHKGPSPGDKKNVLPTKFLLGGNINDPLNLNSLCDEEINRALNQCTPHSSPIPMPAHKKEKVEVLIPPNINDPLNLNRDNADEMGLLSPKSAARKKKNKHKKRKSTGDPCVPVNTSKASACEDEGEEGKQTLKLEKDVMRPMHIHIEEIGLTPGVSSGLPDTYETKLHKSMDQIVSPVIPQRSPPRKRRRTYSEGTRYENCVEKFAKREDFLHAMKIERAVPIKQKEPKQKPKVQRQTSSTKPKNAPKNQKFVYGNYNRYYGYRNPCMEEDRRLKCFRKEWFEGRDVLDIGCNVGHVTLSVARDFATHRITGMDIDGSLITMAKKNIRHYITSQTTDRQDYPVSLPICYGPLAAPPVPVKGDHLEFPHNVMFMTANYVLENDEQLELQKEEYDVILALSITKWVHLNNGDDGLKRFFKRIFKNLRPGGKFILEPQSWASYKKKKKLSDTIWKNFQNIKLRPEQFTEYLLSKEVGFSTCQAITPPFNKSKGFQRPIQVYTKSDTAAATPRDGAESRGVTPLIHTTDSCQGLTPRYLASHPSSTGATPKFEIGSPSFEECSTCQNTPNYSCTPWSGTCTPISEGSSPVSTVCMEPVVNGECVQDTPADSVENGDGAPNLDIK